MVGWRPPSTPDRVRDMNKHLPTGTQTLHTDLDMPAGSPSPASPAPPAPPAKRSSPSRRRDSTRIASRAEPAGVSIRVSRAELELIVKVLTLAVETELAARLGNTQTMIPARLSPAQVRVMRLVHARRTKSPTDARALRPYRALEERGLLECRKGQWYLTDLGREAVRVGWDFAGHANTDARRQSMSS